jgi:tRNA(adenine34) deaminase
MDETDDRSFMEVALQQAREAAAEGEVPVGAALVADGDIVATGRNARETSGDPTAHAEMMAIRAVVDSAAPTRWRLGGTTLYVTLEPCLMCMGAVIQARIDRVVYGCPDPRGGAAETLYRLGEDPRLNHRVEVRGGVLADEAADLLRSFFAQLRRRTKNGANDG